jgi:hypothetical protein
MDTAPVLSQKNLPTVVLAFLMKPFRVGAHLRGARFSVVASIVLPFAMFDFLVAGATGWGAASVLLCLGMAYTLTAKIPRRTRLFRLLPIAALLLAVGLAAVPVPNGAPAGNPLLRIADCHGMNSGPAPCTQPCPQVRGAKQPADSALDPCAPSIQPRGTLKAGAPRAERGGA